MNIIGIVCYVLLQFCGYFDDVCCAMICDNDSLHEKFSVLKLFQSLKLNSTMIIIVLLK